MTKVAKTKEGNDDEAAHPLLVIPRNMACLAEAKRNTWEITCPTGTLPEDLLHGDACGPFARDLTPRDLVYAQPADGAWLAIYRVVSQDAVRAQLALLQVHQLPPRIESSTDAPPGYAIKHNDHHGWHGIRISDGVIMCSQVNTPHIMNREAVRRAIMDHAAVARPHG
jgi:hypothetical protein